MAKKLILSEQEQKSVEFLIQREIYKGKSESVAVWGLWTSISKALAEAKKLRDSESAKAYRGYLNYLETR
jgi:hypothetical protein